jgi:hypothetical protein
MQVEQSQVEDHSKPHWSIYLPKEGLQGENIPSHILWENIQVDHIQISFSLPLKLENVFNAKSFESQNDSVIIKKMELDGYVGLSFKSVKMHEIEIRVSVEYLIYLSDNVVLKETKEITLFRPQLMVNVPTNEISIDPVTDFVKGRAQIKNVGRGTLIMNFSTTKDSQVKLETPREYREFETKFSSDLYEELSNLGREFPSFRSYLDEMRSWDEKDPMMISMDERNQYMEFANRLAGTLASDRKLLQNFVDAYVKAFTKNSKFIEIIRRIIKVYESLVSRDILLTNPFDEVVLTEKKGEIALKILQTDRVFDDYKDFILPKIVLTSSEKVRFPIYKLFEWG